MTQKSSLPLLEKLEYMLYREGETPNKAHARWHPGSSTQDLGRKVFYIYLHQSIIYFLPQQGSYEKNILHLT